MSNRTVLIGVLSLLFCITTSATGGAFDRPAYVPGELFVKFRGDVHLEDIDALKSDLRLILIRRIERIDVEHVRISGDRSVEEIVAMLMANPIVEYAELNYLRYIDTVPNDPSFYQLWGLNNTGQTGGIPDADIDAVEAWDITNGDPNFTVAVIDSGMDMAHLDLAENVWTNPGEIPGNGIDDDGNGYIDDVHGWDFSGRDNDPSDTVSVCMGHGTHVSGTIGAIGNNGIGVAGINWNVKIMPLKVFKGLLGILCSAADSDIINAINYAADQGVKVSNNSYGGGAFSQTVYNAIRASKSLYIAAAGNDGRDNDTRPSYPASYDLSNIISVAATDDTDSLASFSNYGVSSVDIAAPGVYILSTTPNNTYSIYDGTSMATPHVVGSAALLWADDPSLTINEVKWRLLKGADPKGLPVSSGGRLNINTTLNLPPPLVTVELTPSGSTTVPRGGELGYSILIMNQSPTPQAVTISVVAQLPGGSEVFLIRPTPVTMASGTMISRSFSKRIPPNAPTGQYSLFGRAEVDTQSFEEDMTEYTIY